MAVRTYNIGIDKGLLDRSIFTDEEIYQQELERIFTRAWLWIGHDSLVPNPNDFFTTYMGEDPVILTRDAKGELHAMLNMCRHRGNRVVRADDGNAKNFMCTYHGWTYSSDGGKLVSVPGLQEAYYGELDVERLGLIEVAQLDTYAGMVFATWDPEAPSLEEYLGDFRYYLDIRYNRRDNGLRLIGPEKWIMPTNWKMPVDNFAGDGYHFFLTHRSALIAQAKAGKRPNQASFEDNGGHNVDVGNGHGVITNWSETDQQEQRRAQNQALQPRLIQYENDIMPELERRLGSRARRMNQLIGSVFPNMSVHPSTSIRLMNPRGPLKTEAWTFHLAENDAPEDVHRLTRRSGQLAFGIGGIFEQDDMDNFNQCTLSGLSPMGKKVPSYVIMGLGHETTHPALPGKVAGRRTNEVPQRALYARWQDFMNASSWKEISVAPQTAKYEGTATFKG